MKILKAVYHLSLHSLSKGFVHVLVYFHSYKTLFLYFRLHKAAAAAALD